MRVGACGKGTLKEVRACGTGTLDEARDGGQEHTEGDWDLLQVQAHL